MTDGVAVGAVAAMGPLVHPGRAWLGEGSPTACSGPAEERADVVGGIANEHGPAGLKDPGAFIQRRPSGPGALQTGGIGDNDDGGQVVGHGQRRAGQFLG